MEDNQIPLSIDLIYLFCNLALVGLIIGFLFFAVVNVILHTSEDNHGISFYMNVPVRIDMKETGNMNIDDKIVKVGLKDTTSQIQFSEVPNQVAKRFSYFPLVYISFAFYCVFVFRKFIKNVRKREVFTVKNINLLKRISYLLVVVWFFRNVVLDLVAYSFVQKMEFENVSLIKSFGASVDFMNYRSGLFIALFIWVLAHIFIKGLELQKDQDLTV